MGAISWGSLSGCGGGCGCAPCRGGPVLMPAGFPVASAQALMGVEGRLGALGDQHNAQARYLLDAVEDMRVDDRRAREFLDEAQVEIRRGELGPENSSLASRWNEINSVVSQRGPSPASRPEIQAAREIPGVLQRYASRGPDPGKEDSFLSVISKAGTKDDPKSKGFFGGSVFGMPEELGGGLTSFGSALPLAAGAAGGAGLAAGTILHAQKLPDQPVSSRTLKRKKQQAITGGAAGGAVAGASAGTMIFPGIGTIIGGAVGAIGGAAGGFFASKDLNKRNRKAQGLQILQQQQAGAAEVQAAAEARHAAQLATSRARLALAGAEREADRWLIAVHQGRGDVESAQLLRQEVAELRLEATQEPDASRVALLHDQAAESVSMLRSLAEEAPLNTPTSGRRGLAGLGSANEHVFEVRRRNRQALGLTPQEDANSGVSGATLLAGAVLGALLLSNTSRRR